MRLIRAVRDTQEGEAGVQAEPEDDVAEKLVPLDPRDAAERNERNLRDLHK